MSKVMDMFRGLMKKSPSIPAQQHRAFNAARIDRLTASFLATTVSINQELRTDLDIEQPGMLVMHGQVSPRPLRQLQAPARARIGLGRIADRRIAHDLDELVLARHVPIERHRREAQLFSDTTHRECDEAVAEPD